MRKNIMAITANQSLTENLGPNGRIGRRQQKLSTINNKNFFLEALEGW